MAVVKAVALAAGAAVVASAVVVVWSALGLAASVTVAVYFGVAVGAPRRVPRGGRPSLRQLVRAGHGDIFSTW